MIRPVVGSTSFSSSFRSVDLPDPDWPTMKTNSPFSIPNETSSSAITPLSYTFVTFSNTIIGAPVGRGVVDGCSATAMPPAVTLPVSSGGVLREESFIVSTRRKVVRRSARESLELASG